MEDVQVLAFVFVQTFHLHVEDRIRIDRYAAYFLNMLGEADLVRAFCRHDGFERGGIVGKLLEVFQFVKVFAPVSADPVRDDRREIRIRLAEPAAGRDAVRHVDEFIRIEFAEVAEQAVFQQFRVERRHAVDLMAGDDAHIRHARHFDGMLFDD